MKRFLRKQDGQALTEYAGTLAILIPILVGALIIFTALFTNNMNEIKDKVESDDPNWTEGIGEWEDYSSYSPSELNMLGKVIPTSSTSIKSLHSNQTIANSFNSFTLAKSSSVDNSGVNPIIHFGTNWQDKVAVDVLATKTNNNYVFNPMHSQTWEPKVIPGEDNSTRVTKMAGVYGDGNDNLKKNILVDYDNGRVLYTNFVTGIKGYYDAPNALTQFSSQLAVNRTKFAQSIIEGDFLYIYATTGSATGDNITGRGNVGHVLTFDLKNGNWVTISTNSIFELASAGAEIGTNASYGVSFVKFENYFVSVNNYTGQIYAFRPQGQYSNDPSHTQNSWKIFRTGSGQFPFATGGVPTIAFTNMFSYRNTVLSYNIINGVYKFYRLNVNTIHGGEYWVEVPCDYSQIPNGVKPIDFKTDGYTIWMLGEDGKMYNTILRW